MVIRTEAKGLPPGLHHRLLRVLRASKLDGSPGLLWWRCCHGGGFPLQYARACFMTHSFLTLGFISHDDVYITNGVYIFIRKILWSCTVVFLRMSVSFTMYLVRDDLINKWNQVLFSETSKQGVKILSLWVFIQNIHQGISWAHLSSLEVYHISKSGRLVLCIVWWSCADIWYHCLVILYMVTDHKYMVWIEKSYA